MTWTKASSGAYMPYPQRKVENAALGPLTGLTFTAKDMFDVKGYPTSAGSPTLLAMSGEKPESAAAVEMLLAAGARFDGKTVTDELAFSLIGSNAHFGTPVNGAAPDRFAGGSSSGAASAVSCGLCDIGLATDSGGSVRGPASQSGLFGIRPTYGRISLRGCTPLCPRFDTAGFMTKTLDAFRRTANVFFKTEEERVMPSDAGTDPKPQALLVPEDILEAFGSESREALNDAFNVAADLFGESAAVRASPYSLKETLAAYQRLQGKGIWATWGDFIETQRPCFGPGVKERFAFAHSMAEVDLAHEETMIEAVRDHIERLLCGGAILMLPTLAGPGPKRDADAQTLAMFRTSASLSFAIGGLAGVPWLTLPVGTIEGAPIGLSLVGAAGTDRRLVELGAKLYGAVGDRAAG